MSLTEVFQAWGIANVYFSVYQFIVIGIMYFFIIKNKALYRDRTITFFKCSSAFLTSLHVAGMIPSAFGALYILNFIAYITAFVSFVFLMIRDTTYKFKLIFNIGTFVLVYFFNIMAIYLNQDIEKNNGFITLKYPSYMFIPAISCALQNSFFFYNYILYKYEHYNLLEIISVFPDQDCPICLDHLRQKEVAKLKCNHYYHKSCILLHFQHHKNCPICRTEIINPV